MTNLITPYCRQPTARRGFSLLELLFVLILTMILLASFVRALEDAEAADILIRSNGLPRLAMIETTTESDEEVVPAGVAEKHDANGTQPVGQVEADQSPIDDRQAVAPITVVPGLPQY